MLKRACQERERAPRPAHEDLDEVLDVRARFRNSRLSLLHWIENVATAAEAA
jgi:hypothetical protein